MEKHKGLVIVAVIPARYGYKTETKTDKEMAKADITIPLGIQDVRVLKTALNERGEIVITIESTKAGTQCRK